MLATALACASALVAANAWRTRATRLRSDRSWSRMLESTSRQTARVANEWTNERVRDTRALAAQADQVARLGGDGQVAATLDASVRSYDYLGAWMLDDAGRVVARARGAGEPAAVEVARVSALPAADASHGDSTALVGPFAIGDATAVSFLQPALVNGQRRIVVVRADATRLFKLLPREVRDSRTGQSRLVGRTDRGTTVLSPFALEAKEPPRPPLSLHVPRGSAAIEALAGAGVETSGVFTDARGRRVVGATSFVPAAGWGVVRSVDEDELIAADVERLRLERVAVVAFLATIAFGFALVGRISRARRLAAVSERERRYRLLADHAQDLITLVDAGGVIRYVSPAVRRLLGYAHEEVVGRAASEFTERKVDVERIRRAFEQAVPGAPARTVEHGLVRRDGSVVWVESAASAAPVEGGAAMVVVVSRDVSARAALEAELREARTLEAVGRLAGGVAHDFNNVLSVVRLNAEELLEEMPPRDPRRERVQQMRDAAARAGALTRQLLAVGRRQVLRPRTVSLHDVVRDAVVLFDRALSEQVRRDVRLMARAPHVTVDPEQLRAAVLDLALFARDRMPDGGVLSVETADGDGEVRLTMRDTGPALDAVTRAGLFEPYFYAAGEARAVGFGLSTVDGLVRQSGGRIEVESSDGNGAAFHVVLPRAAAEPEVSGSDEGDEPAVQAPEPAAPRRAVVLLVEDEAPMREILARLLRRAGHEVLAASDGHQALAITRRTGVPDVVVTDVVMPEMGGPELADRLQELDPALPVVFMSGYAPESAGRHSIGRSASYLQKPFALRALQDAVARALADRTADRGA